ncbi:TolC family protein [Candidatus Methylomirabilis sp.]|uniref:TolC family protein n=1 Tax=Candidatus Methylomirabilis sp. TaxID=2032687 RepID=UPI002A5B9CE2|nr:TolC family protein [Candidatus Methylomirabilis sp.]
MTLFRPLLWAAALAFIMLPLYAAAAEIRNLALEQAVELALQRNPTLRAQSQGVVSARANEVTAGLLPNPVFVSSSQDFTAGVSQLFERGSKRGRRIDSAKLSTEITASDFSEARRGLVFSVRKTFTDALLARSNLELAQQNLKNFQEEEGLNTIRFQKGDISGADLLKIELQELQFENDVQDANLALKTARTTLRTLLATPELAEEFEIEGELEFREFDMSLADLNELALRNRPDLRSVETLKKKTEADIRLAIANSYTDVSLALGYHHTEPGVSSSINPLFPAGPQENSVGFGFSFPLRIFDRNQGEIARTKAEAIRASSIAEAVRNQISNDVEVSYAAFRTSRERVRLYEQVYLNRAKESREIAEFAYKSGRTSILDLLEAERTHRGVQLAYRQALATYLTNLHQLNAVVGMDVAK